MRLEHYRWGLLVKAETCAALGEKRILVRVKNACLNVRYWHLADIARCTAHVCFLPKADIRSIHREATVLVRAPRGKSVLEYAELRCYVATLKRNPRSAGNILNGQRCVVFIPPVANYLIHPADTVNKWEKLCFELNLHSSPSRRSGYGLGQTACAADLPQRPAAAPLFAPTPIYNWTGIYFGLNGGGGWGRQDPLNLITNRFDGQSIDFSGGVFGGTAGAQIQSGHVVLGFEADLDWAGYKGSATFVPTVGGVPIGGPVSAETKIDWEATARARIGYAQNNWLFYATGGLAVLGAKTSFAPGLGFTCGTFGIVNCSGTNKQVGAVSGPELNTGSLKMSARSLSISISPVRHSIFHTTAKSGRA